MSNIPSYLPVAQQPTGTAPSQAVIPAPPPGLTRLSAGVLVEGTVIGRNQQGLLVVKTSHGELALRTAASPPAQSRVVLQLQPSGGQFRVILLSVQAAETAPGAPAQKTSSPRGGRQAGSQPPASTVQARAAPPPAQTRSPPQPGTPLPTQPRGRTASGQQAAPAIPASGRPAAPPATLSTPSVLSAQSGAPAQKPLVNAPVRAPASSPITTQAAAPANAAAPATVGAPTGAPALATPAAKPGAAPAAAGPANPGLSTGSAAPAAAGPANPGLSPASPAAAGGQTGQVPLPPGGAAAVSTALALPGAASLSGVSPFPTSAAGTPPPGAAIAGAALGADLIRSWPGLDQAIAVLRAASPHLAAPNIDAVMPRAGPQLAGSLALLISALRGGNIRGWLGLGTMRELARASGKEAASRLADEFGQLSRLARTDSGEWRVHALPFFDGSRHQQIQLYIKHRDQGSGGGEDAPARFVFEFDLSRLGTVQLDGLAASRRFDLVVRSHADLPKVIQKEIGALFSRAQEENGFAGEIHFQTVPTFAVAPLGDGQPNTGGVVV